MRFIRFVIFSLLVSTVSPFVPRQPTKSSFALASSLLDEIRSMRVKEIQNELQKRQISTRDVFEKEELVQRLFVARQDSQGKSESVGSAKSNVDGGGGGGVITTPLFFTTMDKDFQVAAVSGGGITVEASKQPYATLQIQVQQNGKEFTLSLLIDTACSGFVLRPEVQRKYNLPSYSTPVTMTGAGGVSQATGLTQIQKLSVGGTAAASFGPMPAVLQDIGGLPSSLDGILGVAFLSQFAAFELDFRQGIVSLYQDSAAIPPRSNETIIADAKMRMLGSLGIYTVDVYFGGRGPVSMLVDTGAACTLLNWKGVADLGVSRDSQQLSRIRTPMGAMGSDNVAIQLTHRIHVSSTLCLGDCNKQGISLAGSRLPVDIGQIPVIDGLPGVGGILGIDALMRCGIVRISCRQPLKITLFD
jgi:predicted aspartyl protease